VSCSTGPCAGQDAFYDTGCLAAGRFVDNGDDTITDNCTGLMWQKVTGNGTTAINWCNALAYCENLDFAGNTDWRLPNVRELQSIADYGFSTPAVDPSFVIAESDCYWSSTSLDNNPFLAWCVNFNVGAIIGTGKGTALFVRAVRATP